MACGGAAKDDDADSGGGGWCMEGAAAAGGGGGAEAGCDAAISSGLTKVSSCPSAATSLPSVSSFTMKVTGLGVHHKNHNSCMVTYSLDLHAARSPLLGHGPWLHRGRPGTQHAQRCFTTS